MSQEPALSPVYKAVLDLPATPAPKALGGGGVDGASRLSRELAMWNADPRSADQIINPAKEELDSRARDMGRNDGFTASATDLTKDSIVGAQFVLNARPNMEMLGVNDPAWEEEFQLFVESHFNTMAESDHRWFDAQRTKTFSEIVRLAVGQYVTSGEVLGTSEWIRQAGRPFSTAIQLISPDRLSNPNDSDDTLTLRRGKVLDQWGAPQAYWFRNGHRYESYVGGDPWRWTRVDTFLPWGRPQVLHIYEQTDPAQNRGIAAMVSVLKEMKMTKQYRDVVLQNAVTNAMYAAAVESELPSDVVFNSLGSGAGADSQLSAYMTALGQYVGASNNMKLDGVKVPHLFPGTKLKFFPAGEIGDTQFEARLLRHLAASFGLSYEEFARDFTQTNYSSARAAMMISWRHMVSKKKRVADRTANFIFGNWLEEMVNAGRVPMPAGRGPSDFYVPGHREAYCAAEWIGAARGQIDEGKETDAAVARIQAGLSTFEDECAKLGKDWRKVFSQRARERKLLATLNLSDLETTGRTAQVPGAAAAPEPATPTEPPQ